jgi:hypothetical protein
LAQPAPMSVSPEEIARLDAVRAAAQRLAQRLRHRDAGRAVLQECSDAVPSWWREGVAGAAIFGEGLLSLPAASEGDFSRPVTLLSAAEISTAAGGEYVPLAWVDAGAEGKSAIALVRDQGDLAVAVREVTAGDARAALDESAAGAQPDTVADSLVEFLDMLMPQTLCRFASGDAQRSVELCGERSLLIERDGKVERRDFDSADDVGTFVATFMSEALDAGMRTVCCPASMRPLVAGYMAQRGGQAGGQVSGQAAVPPEIRAQMAIQRLVATETLELVEDANLDQLIDEAARYLERQSRAAGNGQVTLALARRFVEWLLQNPAVDDLYADDEAVRAALDAVPAPPKS